MKEAPWKEYHPGLSPVKRVLAGVAVAILSVGLSVAICWRLSFSNDDFFFDTLQKLAEHQLQNAQTDTAVAMAVWALQQRVERLEKGQGI